MKKRSNFHLLYITIGICLTMLSSCNKKNEKDIQSLKEFKIAYLPISECAQIYVAKEKGFFEKHGLKVIMVMGKGGQNNIDRLYSHEVDVAFASFATLLTNRASQNENADKLYSVFGATYETVSNQNHGIFIRRNKYKSETKLKDILSGLKIGINEPKRMEHAVLNEYMRMNDISVESFQGNILMFPFSKMYDVLKDGSIDVACMVEPQITLTKNDSLNYVYIGNHYLNVTNNLPLPVATYISLNSITTEKEILFKEFIQSMIEATEYIKNFRNETKPIISKYTQINTEIMGSMGLPDFKITYDANDLKKVIHLIDKSGFFDNRNIPNETDIKKNF